MPEVILKNLPFLLTGLRVTAEIALLSTVGGTLLAVAIGVLRYLRMPFVAQCLDLYVLFMRGTPLLVVLFICYFALPALLGYRPTRHGAAVAGFILFIGAYLPGASAPACDRSRRPGAGRAGTGLTRAARLIVVPIAANVIQSVQSIRPVVQVPRWRP